MLLADPVQSNAHASLLYQLVDDLQAPYGYERSLRLTSGALLANRFLLTLTKENIPSDPDATVVALCRRLAMPDNLVAATAAHIGAAKFIHFGFEEDETTCLYKVYLEFPAEPHTPGVPVLGTVSTIGAALLMLLGYLVVLVLRRRRAEGAAGE